MPDATGAGREVGMGEYPEVRRVIVNLCVACIKGEGQECHTPGCALWLHKVDLPIGEEFLEDADALVARAEAAERDRDEWMGHAINAAGACAYVYGYMTNRWPSEHDDDLAAAHRLFDAARRVEQAAPPAPPEGRES